MKDTKKTESISSVRTRMAPSPTGEYHIGHIRTVLYNYAFTKANNGTFIIRIEDTDRTRYVDGAIERILNVITAYNLNWDEGPGKEGACGPYIQSQRLSLYKEYAEKLIDKGHAYRCFCTKEDLDKMREEQRNKGYAKTMYDGRCSQLTKTQVTDLLEKETPYVVRQKVPKNETVSFVDEVYGELTFETNEVDETVLLKSDGFPTYHLGVVVDDHLMRITHIMRGNDWLPSTPKHILLYKAFGWEFPTYIHLPNLKEKGQNRKLSKRFGSVFAIDFLEEGYLPEALLNFLMLLGWNPGTEKEIYSLDEFIKDFSIDRIHKTDLVAFDREKLLWMNGYYIRNMSLEVLWESLCSWAEKYNVDLHTNDADDSYNIKVLALVQERLKKYSEFVSLTTYFYKDPQVDEKLLTKFAQSEQRTREILSNFVKMLDGVDEGAWNVKELEFNCHNFIEKNDYKPKEAFMTLRAALTGEKATPPVFDLMEVLSKEVVLRRLKRLV